MEDCKICYSNESNKKLPCGHELCSSCCVRLNSAICPYCRQNFIFNADEIKQRLQLGIINGYKREIPPVPILPRDWITPVPRQLDELEIHEPFSRIINPPFSGIVIDPYARARRSGERRRRRFLSLDEVLERRKQLKERKARHWEKKNAQATRHYQSVLSGLITIDS
jgi:hypothetical protein